jgi:uncharacterized damage-inducible protein DinB
LKVEAWRADPRFEISDFRRRGSERGAQIGDPSTDAEVRRAMTTTARIPGFLGEYLWELDIVTRQLVAMAEALPAEKYGWRPDPKARPVSAVLVHVSAGNFMLLEAVGVPAPDDLYGVVPGEGEARLWGQIRRNDELEAAIVEKAAVVDMLKKSLDSVRRNFSESSEDDLERSLHFFGEETTVRRVYLRLLAHAHEHMGQMIAFLRFNGMAPPWPDWRPDRQRL